MRRIQAGYWSELRNLVGEPHSVRCEDLELVNFLGAPETIGNNVRQRSRRQERLHVVSLENAVRRVKDDRADRGDACQEIVDPRTRITTIKYVSRINLIPM